MARSMSDRKAQEWRQRLVRFEKSRHTHQRILPARRRFAAVVLSLAEAPWPRNLPAQPPDAFRPVRLLAGGGVSVQLPGGTQLVVPTSDAAEPAAW